jgi:hypothetical protein
MSTRKIREALEALPFYAVDAKEACDLADAAMAEVEAIHAMAKRILHSDNHHGGVSEQDRPLLESIAKEAP